MAGMNATQQREWLLTEIMKQLISTTKIKRLIELKKVTTLKVQQLAEQHLDQFRAGGDMRGVTVLRDVVSAVQRDLKAYK
jgi:hypothetical protein